MFQQFAAAGSVRQTLLWFRSERVELPAVEYGPFGRTVVWKLPVYNTLHKIITNPIYAGAYVFGRTVTRTKISHLADLVMNWPEFGRALFPFVRRAMDELRVVEARHFVRLGVLCRAS